MRLLTTMTMIFALVCTVACGDDAEQPGNNQTNNDNQNEPEPIPHEFENEGAVCVGKTGDLDLTDGPIEVGDTIDVYVQFADCLSSSCSTGFKSECELLEWGSGIYRVTSSGAYDDLAPVEDECTADCNNFSTRCGEITFEWDTVALVHGDEHYYVEPGSERRCIAQEEADEPEPVVRTYDDDGPVCFGQPHPDSFSDEKLEADEPFPVTVSIESCLSSSCSDDQQADCEIEIDGHDIFVFSAGSYSDRTHLEEMGCTSDCAGGFFADCGEITLEEGTYTVHHGDETSEVTIPSDDTTCQ